MTTHSATDPLQGGLEALNRGHFAKAVTCLSRFCQQHPTANAKAYLQAHMGLVRAYSQLGQTDQAIAICQQLTAHSAPQVQAWAQKSLHTLQAASSQQQQPPEQSPAQPTGQSSAQAPAADSPDSTAAPDAPASPPEAELQADEAAALYRSANSLMRQGAYADAIAALEVYCRGTRAGGREWMQAQMWLAKAYQAQGQLADAIALCQSLTQSNSQATKIWAEKFLTALAPKPAAEEKPVEAEPAGFPLKTIDEFKQFCQQNLADELRAIEKIRKQTLQQIAFVGSLLGVVFILILLYTPGLLAASTQSPRQWLTIGCGALMGMVGCLWAGVMFYSSSTETYASGFSARIIEKIIAFIDPDRRLTYAKYSDNAVTLASLQHSKLFPQLAKRSHLSQDDCVSGKIGNTSLFFSEVVAESEFDAGLISKLDISRYIRVRRVNPLTLSIVAIAMLIRVCKGAPYVTRRILKGQRIHYQHFKEEVIDNQFSRKLVFKGMFFVADFNKHFRGRTVVLPGAIGSNVQMLNKVRGQLVKLEDPEFMKLFSVYSNDQVEARYILSTSLMQRLVNFRNRAKRKLFISFSESLIYIAVEYEEDLFEPRLFKTMLDFQPLRDYFDVLNLMLSTVEDLNLNRRIWTKT